MKIIVTGANGFVGQAVCQQLHQSAVDVVGVVRRSSAPSQIAVGDIDGSTNWGAALSHDADAVVHLAGKTPLSADESPSSLSEYRRINIDGAGNLARQCAAAGIKRFVYVSSAHVFGHGSLKAYSAKDPVAPADAYSDSKWQAECLLRELAQTSAMELVIVRPPLVYGPGVKGNFLRLIKAVDRRWPLPLGAIKNCRSLIYLDNLADAIVKCATAPAAKGQTFTVSDDDDVSSPELIQRMGAALRRKPLLLPIPMGLLRLAGAVTEREAQIDRLIESMTLDIRLIKNELDWRPPYTMQEGLAMTAKWYRNLNQS